MKVSVNWIKEYIDFDLPPIDELVTRIGAQLGAVEEVIDLGAKYKGVVVAKVVSCEKHPNADKLSVCTIDDGGVTPDVNRDENGFVQVVCGAPNVREGLFVAWIPPKAIVPSTYDSDPFTLEARELRGIVSNGMLASGQELEINDDHSGILEIDEEVQPGQSLAEVYKLDDYIIDIENKMFTHRPDCFGQLGVAREIAGILGHKFTSPDWYKVVRQDIFNEHDPQTSKPVPFGVDLPDLVPRFIALSISGVTVKPSPIMMQSFLSRVGVRPINNIVDVTNYVMMLTGQPLHAYDYDKISEIDHGLNTLQAKLQPEIEAYEKKKKHATLRIRHPQEGETIKLLNGKEITPRPEAIMIASQKQLIGIGGVMGGANTEVDDSTKNIILECANFDMYSIRRTSMAHGLFTDAVSRFNKGQSPLQNDRVIAQATHLLQEIAGGEEAGCNDFIKGDDFKRPLPSISASVEVTAEFINARLGLSLNEDEIRNILENVEFDVSIEGEILKCNAPFWRTDIAIPEDIVEEVGRLHGFDKLPFELPLRKTAPTQRNALLEVKSRVRETLSRAGANEVSTYSFVHENLLEKVGQNKELAFQINNALSPDLQYYRLSLTPSLLEKIHPNIKAGYRQGFGIYEIGKAHIVGFNDRSEPDMPMEFNAISFVYATEQAESAAYYEAKNYLQYLIDVFKVKGVEFLSLSAADVSGNPWLMQVVVPYDPERSAVIRDTKGVIWGVVGEYKASVRKNLKLPGYTAGFEVAPLLLSRAEQQTEYTPLPKFPKVMQDITLAVPSHVTHAALRTIVDEYLHAHKPEHTLLTVEDKDIYQKEDDPEHMQVTFGITIASYQKTMQDQEVSKLLEGLAENVAEKTRLT